MYEEEETEECEDEEPCDGDYILSDVGQLGGQTGVSQYGKYLGTFTEYTDVERFIRERMEREQFWPDVWQVSDHGNVSLYTMESKG